MMFFAGFLKYSIKFREVELRCLAQERFQTEQPGHKQMLLDFFCRKWFVFFLFVYANSFLVSFNAFCFYPSNSY